MCVCVGIYACVYIYIYLSVVTMLQAGFESEIPVLRHKRLCVSYTVWLCGCYDWFI
jgi:hypothetical protein